ncbi:hypothetical protein [Sulfitobacter sp. JL08]|uniref:hypothetical protein n=1 Tax=Sulfitobacter sp. JL08 TaxID=2070369 RepID=UPI001963B45E|nr:hypothetical protein [Sulfitobacter sp. JL08]
MFGLRIWILGISLVFSAVAAHASQFEIVDWRGGQALKMTGKIDLGTAARFNSIADRVKPAEHGLPILLLDSPGGNVFEALLLSAAMKNRPFHTVIADDASCASACASIVFIAGKYRTMEHFGRFGQHSCSVSGAPDSECNELISQHAISNGVSHGSVAAFVTYTAPTEMLWFSREDIDGWGISHYPGSEESGFEKSEPRVFRAITGKLPAAQSAWRLDFWKNGWRAFNRPSSDAERELQLNQFCVEHIPGVLFLAIEIHGPSEVVEEVTQRVVLLTDVFSLETSEPMIWQEDRLVTMVAIPIPTEKVLAWLTEVSQYEFRIDTKQPYEPIGAIGYLSGSRKNLIFAANNCDYRANN